MVFRVVLGMITIEASTKSTNVPNLKKLRLIAIDDVLEIAEPIGDDWSIPLSGLVCKTGVTLIDVKFGYRMASFSEDMQTTPNGVNYLQRVEAIIPKDCPQVVTGINFLQNRKFLGLIKDGNGRLRILGTRKQPLRVTVNLLTIGDNSRALTLQAEVKQQGYFYGSIRDDVLIAKYFNQTFTVNFI